MELTTALLFAGVLAVFFRLWQWNRERSLRPSTGAVVVVTGCDTGFGRSLARRLVREGVKVVAGCLKTDSIAELESECRDGPGVILPVQLDITKPESIDNLFRTTQAVLDKYHAKLHALVNNAGYLAIYGPMDWISVDEYQHSLDVNLMGAIRMTKKFVPLIKESKGRLVNMISASGRIHGFYTTPYVVAKFAMQGFVDSLRLELRPFGVDVVILEPGAFKTNLMCPQAMISRVESVWRKLDDVTREEYGVAFKDNYVDRFNNGTRLLASHNVESVTDAYFHALFAEHPRKRYTVGWDARLILLPMSYLPSSVQDWLIWRMMDITSGGMLPASLANCNSNTVSKKSSKPEYRRAQCPSG